MNHLAKSIYCAMLRSRLHRLLPISAFGTEIAFAYICVIVAILPGNTHAISFFGRIYFELFSKKFFLLPCVSFVCQREHSRF